MFKLGIRKGFLNIWMPYFFMLLLTMGSSFVSLAQSNLVRWPNVNFTPTILNSNVIASNITTGGGVTIAHQNWDNQNNFFQFLNWSNGGLNVDRYIEITVSPQSGYMLQLQNFNFYVKKQWGDNAQFQIRISKDNFATYQIAHPSTVLSTSWTSVSANISGLNPIIPTQPLKIRIYAFADYGLEFQIKRMMNSNANNNFSQTPVITGNVIQAEPPEAKNDVVSTILNTPITIDVLTNDTYSNLSSINITQAPTNGSVTVNGISNITYTPNNSYSGPDQFRYTITDQYTTSTPAIVDINISNPAPQEIVDVSILQTISNLSPVAGSHVTYTIKVANSGPSAATNLIVNHLVPTGLAYVSSQPSIGSYSVNSGAWNVGVLGKDQEQTLEVTAKVLNTGTYKLNSLFTLSEVDNQPSNNTHELIFTPIIPSVDLGLNVTVNNNTPAIGSQVTFTTTVNNLSVENATGVLVNALLPSGFAYVSHVASVGNYNSNSGIWDVGSLNSGGTATLNVVAERLSTGSYTKSVSVQHDGTDPVSNNNVSSVSMAFACDACTHPITGSVIVVNAGEVYCLESGSWSGGVTMNGGTICVSSGATMTVNYINGDLDGVIKNNGTITNFPMISGASKHLTILNFGSISAPYLQTFSGELFNYGTMNISGQFSTINGSVIHNYGDLNARQISFNGSTLVNHAEGNFIVSHGVTVAGGDWENKLGGTIHFQGTSNSNVNFSGNIDNLGYWEFGRISGISSTLNNYGEMKVHHTASNISSTTYITNDGLLEFINVAEVQYNGPMLTNNGTLTISHPTSGNFKMNQSINQVYNNGLISITGEFQQNAAGNILVNNCTIDCKTFFVGNGSATNNGLINSFGTSSTGGRPDGLVIEGSSSFFISGKTGFTQGMNFRNSGHISGYGVFYFTGNTNNNSAGSFIGSSATEQILFYDASPPASGLFDAPGATTQNVIRPGAMSPQELSSYNCEAPPTYAGSPPITLPYSTIVCDPADLLSISFHIDDYATPADPVAGDPFVLLLNTIKLFDYTNLSNPTNNTTSLTIPGKGTLQVDALGQFTFVPDPSFTAGVFEAEYRISNKRSGDVVTYPSPKTKITIKLININLPAITAAGNSNEVCVGSTLALSNLIEGGVWSSSNTSVATIDETGIVTGLAIGTTMISYTKTEESCSDTVQFELTVKNCPAPSSKLISNPMIRQRIGGGN